MSCSSRSSHWSQASGGSITGIRSWISAIFSLGSPVMIVQDTSSSSLPSGRQTSHRPAKAIGSSSGRWMNHGCFLACPSRLVHS